MTLKMPLDQFERVSASELHKFQEYYTQLSRIETVPRFTDDESTTGFIFCADLEFPEEAQRRLLSFPLAPEALIVDEGMLSEGNMVQTFQPTLFIHFTKEDDLLLRPQV